VAGDVRKKCGFVKRDEQQKKGGEGAEKKFQLAQLRRSNTNQWELIKREINGITKTRTVATFTSPRTCKRRLYLKGQKRTEEGTGMGEATSLKNIATKVFSKTGSVRGDKVPGRGGEEEGGKEREKGRSSGCKSQTKR